jgi:acyl carrier protein
MNITDFIKNFADQFDDTEPSVFNENTNFKELEEYSSLTALNIISMVDDEYNVYLKGDDIRNSNTIAELYKIVESRIGE